MTEIELKFQVAAPQRDAVARAVASRGAQQLRLAAQYFDSDDRRLANARLALRVRREGRRWVQTLKGAGDGLWQRFEHEVVLPPAARADPPAADPALHAGTAAGDALRTVIAGVPLHATYATRVTRTLRRLRAPGCVVELAFDEGELIARGRRAPLCELEFELESGDAAAMCRLAEGWVSRFGLSLDVRSKSERGDRLARGMPPPEPLDAGELKLPRHVDSATAVRAIVAGALRQVLGNASELLHGDGAAEQVHQLRIGLRRLRTALHELGGWVPRRDDWLAHAKQVFDGLAAQRDRDAVGEWLLPALHRAGACDLTLPNVAPQSDRPSVLGAPATTRLWLELLAFVVRDDAASADEFAVLAAQRLQHLHRQVRRDARRFAELDDAARHRLRKRVKRLRYLCEFAASQFKRARVDAYLHRLKPAQAALGHYQDVGVARSLFAAAGDAAGHGFALGWLARERDVAAADAAQSLAAFRKAKPFW